MVDPGRFMSEPEHKSITGELTEQEVEVVDTVLDEEAPYTAFRAREHRERVIREFLDHPNVPARREEGAPYRTPEKARLDFAFQKAAERASRCESTVREGTLNHYEGDYQTKRFRKDLQQIEQKILSK